MFNCCYNFIYIINYFVILKLLLQVHLGKDYLQLEPIGCLFILGFVLLLFIQFIAMLFHRYDTFIHLLSNTSINLNCCVKVGIKKKTYKLLFNDFVMMSKIIYRLMM